MVKQVTQKHPEQEITDSRHSLMIDRMSRQVQTSPSEVEATPYLILILDCLVKNRPLLKACNVNVNMRFLKELKHSVDLMLRADVAIKEDTRRKIMNAFSRLIDDHDDCFEKKKGQSEDFGPIESLIERE